MIDHLSSYATDYPKTRDFYLETLSALGYPLVMELIAEWNSEFPSQRMCAFGPDNKPVFWIIETKTPHTPRHIAFTAADRNAVSRFYQLALEHGGQCNGQPAEASLPRTLLRCLCVGSRWQQCRSRMPSTPVGI